MTESLITISLAGLIAGFLLSMPIAGPISILITSNALKGRTRYCNRATVGASFADFVYVFIAVYGITRLYSLYQPFIPYILLIGSLFLLFLGYKIFRTDIDLEHIDEKGAALKVGEKDKGGFRTGFMISFLNPTLFLSWMTSSFFVITLVTSWGFDTGGLAKSVEANYNAINHNKEITVSAPENSVSTKLDSALSENKDTATKTPEISHNFSLLLSLCYAFCIAVGSIIWFYYLALFLSKFRHRINIKVINRIIQGLGIILCGFGLVLAYKAIALLI